MCLLDRIREYQQEIKELKAIVTAKQNECMSFIYNNVDEIKKNHFPIKNKIYRVQNLYSDFSYGCNTGELSIDNIYYFKPYDTRFFPMRDRQSYPNSLLENGMPTVLGSLLDCHYREIEGYKEERVQITNLIEISKDDLKGGSKFTYVYVMIDKNTGYYKIGHSKNPKYRESTLQSEKPTIELIHTYNAKISDEKHLHDTFSDKRIRGEWFDLSGSDIQLINSYFQRNPTIINTTV